MPHLKPAPLLAIAVVVCVGVASVFVAGTGLPPVLAAPLSQFPTNSVTVISDPPPPDLPGQFSAVTLQRSGPGGFLDPDPNWRLPTFDDSAWQPSYPVVTQPAWGTPVDSAPPVDFIWGGPPGTPGAGGRFNIFDTGSNQQYLFVRKNFCIPINATLTSVAVVNPARFEIAATPGNAEITFNGANVVTNLAGNESDVTYNLDLTTPVNLARRIGRNTLTLRVRDDEADTRAGLAYNLQFNYAIDTGAITLNSAPNPSAVNTAVNFSQTNTGLSGDAPYTFDWNFGDGTTSTAATPSKIYAAPGTYTVALTMTDRFGCPSAPVTLVQTVVPQVSFSSGNYSVTEGAGSATITVILNAPSPVPVTVNYATANGTAIAGSDYTASSGTLTFPPNVTSQSFTVPIVIDGVAEANETVNLSLSNANNALIGLGAATLTIIDGGQGLPPGERTEEGDDDDDEPPPTPTPTPLPPPPTSPPLPTPTPGGPLYLPETGILDQPVVVNLTRSTFNYLVIGGLLAFGMGGVLFLLVRSYLTRRWFSERD